MEIWPFLNSRLEMCGKVVEKLILTGVSILIFSEAEIEKNKKIFQKQTRPAEAGWPKRLKLVQATHMAILPLSL